MYVKFGKRDWCFFNVVCYFKRFRYCNGDECNLKFSTRFVKWLIIFVLAQEREDKIPHLFHVNSHIHASWRFKSILSLGFSKFVAFLFISIFYNVAILVFVFKKNRVINFHFFLLIALFDFSCFFFCKLHLQDARFMPFFPLFYMFFQ